MRVEAWTHIQVLFPGAVASLALLARTAKQTRVVRESPQVKKCRASTGTKGLRWEVWGFTVTATWMSGKVPPWSRGTPLPIVFVASSGGNCLLPGSSHGSTSTPMTEPLPLADDF